MSNLPHRCTRIYIYIYRKNEAAILSHEPNTWWGPKESLLRTKGVRPFMERSYKLPIVEYLKDSYIEIPLKCRNPELRVYLVGFSPGLYYWWLREKLLTYISWSWGLINPMLQDNFCRLDNRQRLKCVGDSVAASIAILWIYAHIKNRRHWKAFMQVMQYKGLYIHAGSVI